jgi:glycerol-3-phosphate dehydrogenase
VPRERIDGQMGVINQTEKSVLFIIPWDRYWIIGTTDTPWSQDLQHPVATATDIDYILEHANAVLAKPLKRDDVIGVFAGLRPLLQRGTKAGTDSARVSREHTVASPSPGLTVIAGGKLTTYRVMAKDAVDFALGKEAKQRPSVTKDLPLVGAEGFDQTLAQREQLAERYGWTAQRISHLLGRYGSRISDITSLIDSDSSLKDEVPNAEAYIKAEIVYAVTHEGALNLSDVLTTRTRLNFEVPDGGVAAAEVIANLMAPLLGWDGQRKTSQLEAYSAGVKAEKAATLADSDSLAEQRRLNATDPLPMRALVSVGGGQTGARS